MIKSAAAKYHPFQPIALPDRRWPDQRISRAPVWMSTDLRDGNQALFEPMDAARKMRLFHTLVDVGFKEIEVAFPSASQTEFDFVRELIEGGHISEDVTIQVLTQAREHLIRRTVESLAGARRAIVHVYNATAPDFREIVFGMSRAEVVALAVESVSLIRALTDRHPETEWVLEYSPEVFSSTELDFALEVSDAVSAAWGASPARKMILNLPATIEMASPNVYADQIEWMHHHLARRDGIVLSVHPHNDRGCAVAAAELAVMAGADRVEGCLFGNGERTGNVDLVTLALNLYSQGVDPGLDFSDIDGVAQVVQECTRLPIHPRHPYVGDLVFTAFSGSHQDAIHKGLQQQLPETPWRVPYLPVDPADLGRTYDSVIRINSQSGKGGVAHLLERQYGVHMPRRMQVEFSAVVQAHTDAHGTEVGAEELWALFQATYLQAPGSWALRDYHLGEAADGRQNIRLVMSRDGRETILTGSGNGPLEAAVHALGLPVRVHSFTETALERGSDARALALVEVAVPGRPGTRFGAGIATDILRASLQALVQAVNRAQAEHAAGDVDDAA